ncbi:MAG: hypothetical protein RJA09_1201, partial [Pseudomonadota bacterium]|jgi:flagellin
MALGINTNLSALTVQRQMSQVQGGLGTSLQRLSSGLRINSAKDDAAGLAISERFTSQIRGLNQAARNANDGISLMQTAEGAMGTIASNLQRIRELAVQAANGTNSGSDRQALQAEINQLAAEIDRTSVVTEFNGMRVFDQARYSAVGDLNQLAVQDGLTGAGSWLENSETVVAQYYGLTGTGAQLDIRYTGDTDGVGGWLAYVQTQGTADANGRFNDLKLQVDMADFVPPNLPDGGSAPYYNDRVIMHEMAHAVMANTTNWSDLTSNHLWFVEGTAEFIHGAEERVQGDVAASSAAAVVAAIGGPSNTSAFYSSSYSAVRYVHDRIKAAGGEGIKDVLVYMNQNAGSTLNQALANASSGQFASAADALTQYNTNGAAFIGTFDFTNADTGAIGGLDVDGGAVRSATSTVANQGSRSGLNVTDGFVEDYETIATAKGGVTTQSFQVGANGLQTIDTRIGAMNLDTMGLRTTLDVTTLPAQTMLAVDRALDYISGQRAVVGAQMSRLEQTVVGLQISAENLSASRSRVQDADFATETSSLVRAQILQDAGMAMAAQANQLPELVLQLILN